MRLSVSFSYLWDPTLKKRNRETTKVVSTISAWWCCFAWDVTSKSPCFLCQISGILKLHSNQCSKSLFLSGFTFDLARLMVRVVDKLGSSVKRLFLRSSHRREGKMLKRQYDVIVLFRPKCSVQFSSKRFLLLNLISKRHKADKHF